MWAAIALVAVLVGAALGLVWLAGRAARELKHLDD